MSQNEISAKLQTALKRFPGGYILIYFEGIIIVRVTLGDSLLEITLTDFDDALQERVAEKILDLLNSILAMTEQRNS